MIVGFNPSVSNRNNTHTAFKRNFTQKELDGLIADKAEVCNNVMVAIGIRLIKAQDGADKTIKKLLELHPDNRLIRKVAAKFGIS